MIWIVYALVFALIGTGWQIWDWWHERKKQMRECSHRWEWRSLDGLDHGYERVCIDCPYRESVKREDVPYEERKRRGYRG